MFGSKSNLEERLAKLLRRADFDFDRQGIKNRLLTSIQTNHFKPSDFPLETGQPKWKLATATGLIVIFVFAGTLTYADTAKPGDKLYLLDQWQEQFVLKLPRSEQSKAKLKSQIINERMQEFNKLKKRNSSAEIEALKLRTIHEAQKNLIETVDETAKIKQQLRQSGKGNSTAKVDNILYELENLAGKQEAEIEEFNKNNKGPGNIQTNLEATKKARLKARLELGL